jgi:hypothetical protein
VLFDGTRDDAATVDAVAILTEAAHADGSSTAVDVDPAAGFSRA